jgi:hypothetical protein
MKKTTNNQKSEDFEDMLGFCCLFVSCKRRENRIRIDIRRATTPPSLLGTARRMA